MTSILTNTSSMVALQTLKGINNNLNQVQTEISTGKSVSSAKDNSAIWAISKVMESDVLGFQAISDSLSLGESTVAVARQASETVTDLLTQMKEKIVAAQEDNVDRTKIDTDVTALKNQIDSVVKAAQFNGLNLVDGSVASADVLASLDRGASGAVTSSSITVAAQDLSTGGYTAKAAFTNSAGVSTTEDTFATTLAKGSTTAETIEIADITYAAGDKISVSIGDQSVSHTVTADEVAASTTNDLIAASLKSKIDGLGIVGLEVDFTADDGTNGAQLAIASEAAAYSAGPPEQFATLVDLTISGQFTNAGSGGLGALSTIDVSSAAGATAALGTIETLIQTAIDSAAAFGSVEGRIETQSSFISNLTDSLKAGIGSMIDADMEEASAKLQALQVQQQLGIQSLSIANQSPQSVLSLFQ